MSSVPLVGIAASLPQTVPISGNVPAGLDQAVPLGAVAADRPMSVSVGLALRNVGELTQFLADLQNPDSPAYHQFLTSGAFDERFGPSADSVAIVTAWLTAQGFVVKQESSRHLSAKGTVGLVEKAFGVRINQYVLDGKTVVSNDRDPSLPVEIAPLVLRIGGMDTVTALQPRVQVDPLHTSDAMNAGTVIGRMPGTSVGAITGDAPDTPAYQHHKLASGAATVLDKTLKTAYNLDTTLTGIAGNEIAIVSSYALDAAYADLNYILSAQGYPSFAEGQSGARTITQWCTYWSDRGPSSWYWYWYYDGGCSYPSSYSSYYSTADNWVETALDAQMVAGVAQTSHIGVYLAPYQYVDDFSAVYQYVADNANTIKVVGHSWGLCVPQMPSSAIANDEASFAKGFAGGQAWFVASGDSGSADCSGSSAAAVDYPAASPFVTAVGGTVLQGVNTGSSNNNWVGEVACATSGGGYATGFSRPSWQTVSNIPGSTRLVPDLSVHYGSDTCGTSAGYGYNILARVNGQNYEIWGTSPDSQFMAGTWAALNGWATMYNTATPVNLGPAAPLVNQVLSGVRGASAAYSFHDITSGCNGAYCAGPGYDLVTGLGSPKFNNLALDLGKIVGRVTGLITLPTLNLDRLHNLQFLGGISSIACGNPANAQYAWNFGDGVTSTLKNPTHQYSAIGNFPVTLTVTGECGLSHTVSGSLAIANLAPSACLTLSGLNQAGNLLAGSPLTLSATCSSDLDGTLATFRYIIDGVTQPDQASATLQRTWTSLGQHTASVIVVDNNGAVSSPSASNTVNVVSGALATIRITGVDQLLAGASAIFNLAGLDAYGNPVSLAQNTLSYTAPTRIGSVTVSYTEQGVTGSKTVSVVAGPLRSIVLSGPDVIVAGTSAVFNLLGYDQYGNLVNLAQSQMGYVAPTSVGTVTVSYTEQGITGSKQVAVIAGPLALITVNGPVSLSVGTSAVFSLLGFDSYGNPVGLAQSQLTWTAPTTPGTRTVSYAEQGITGSKQVSVVVGPLATISVTGPGILQSGASAVYNLAGFDSYGNAVALAQNQLPYTAPHTIGTVTVSYTELGVTGSKNVQIVPGPLALITITGADTLTAGASSVFSLLGFDQYGNAVSLAQSQLTYTAPATVGSAVVSYTEQGVTGSKTVNVLAAPLWRITVTGPDGLAVGQSAIFGLAGFDQYGNAVGLAQTQLSWTAPTTPGVQTVSYTEKGVTGSKQVNVVSGNLARITVSGPASLAAGASQIFSLAGFDSYGNAVTLAQSQLNYVAPTSVGSVSVCYAEQGVSGCKIVNIVAGPLASIQVTGPAAVVAGASNLFYLAGFDSYGNAVGLAQGSLTFTAPATVGSAVVSYTEKGVTGSKTVQVLAAPLATIQVSGPASLMAGASGVFGLLGFDQYGNAVGLAQSQLTFTAPTTAGSAVVSYAEKGITGSKTINVLPAALATIQVSGPASLMAGASGVFGLLGFDQYGNAVSLAQSQLTYTAPATVGSAVVSYAEKGITGSKTISVVHAPLARIAVSGPASLVAATSGTFGVLGFDQYGNAVSLARTSIQFTAPTVAGTVLACYSEQGVNGCAPVNVLPAALDHLSVAPNAANVVVDSTLGFAAQGFDRFGNSIDVAAQFLADRGAFVDPATYRAPVQSGGEIVTATVQGVKGAANIEILPDQLYRVVVSGPVNPEVATSAAYTAAGFDRFGNPVPMAPTWNTNLGSISSNGVLAAQNAAASGVVTASQGGLSVSLPISLKPGVVHHLALSPSGVTTNVGRSVLFAATGFDRFDNAIGGLSPVWTATLGAITATGLYTPSAAGAAQVTATLGAISASVPATVLGVLNVAATMEYPSYMPQDALVNGVKGVAHVAFVDETAASGAAVTLKISQMSSLGSLRQTTTTGTTDAAGEYVFSIPQAYLVPGDYIVSVTAVKSGNSGTATAPYHIGA